MKRRRVKKKESEQLRWKEVEIFKLEWLAFQNEINIYREIGKEE